MSAKNVGQATRLISPLKAKIAGLARCQWSGNVITAFADVADAGSRSR